MVIDQTAEPFFQSFATKIYEQPDGLICQTEVGKQLLCVCTVQALQRFNFNNESMINHDIYLECSFKFRPFKFNINALLTINMISHSSQFACKNDFIDTFQKAGSQFTVNANCQINDIPAYFIDVFQNTPPRLRASARTKNITNVSSGPRYHPLK